MGPPSGPAPVIPGYRDLSYLGHGATSVVYRGLEVEFNRYVAVKVLGSDDPEDPARARFEREKSVIGRLGETHRNIVRVFRAGLAEDGRPFVSMQLYDGSAQDWIDANGSFPVDEADAIMVASTDARRSQVTQEAIDAIQAMKNTLNGGMIDNINQFIRHGDVLNPENFDGAQADGFYGEWPGTKTALQNAVTKLNEISDNIMKANQNIQSAGGYQ